MSVSLAELAALVLVLLIIGEATSKYCDGGHYCSPPKECCTLDCCYASFNPPGYRPPAVPPPANLFSIVLWNHWFLVLFLVLSCIGGYSLWRRWHPALSRCWCFCCCCRSSGELGDEDPNSEQESTRSCCPPPHYSRCSSFRHAPPPYTEVTSKPDLYPLVISYGDSGKTGPGSSYLMVQYFRNYIVRPVGSLSATSTADSLSSSFLCSAANEANSVIPPPYSCSLDELQATPGHLPFLSIPHSQPSLPSRSPSCEMPLSASLPRHNGSLHLNQSYVSGTAMSTTGSDVSSLAGVGTPGSPPRATSPTQEIRELLDKIQQLPLEETPHDLSGDCGVPTGFIVKSKWHRGSGRSLYMPIDMGLPPNNNNKGRQWLPRSAPNTPSSPFLPCPFQIEPLQSSSRGHRQTSTGRKEDDSPLLGDYCLDEEYESSQVV